MRKLTGVNARAGGLKVEDIRALEQLFVLHDSEIIVSSSPEEMFQKMQQYGEAPDLLGAMGGDGTFAQMLTWAIQIWGKPPPIVLYPCGSHSNAAGYLDSKKVTMPTIDQLIEEICHAERLGNLETIERAYLSISSGETIQYGFNFAAGLIPKILALNYGLSYEEIEALTAGERSMKEIFEARPKSINGVNAWTRTLGKGVRALCSPQSNLRNWLHVPIQGEAYINDERIETEDEKVSEVYTSTFGHASLSILNLYAKLFPEMKPGEINTLVSSLTPTEVIFSVYRALKGIPLRKTSYLNNVEEIVIKPVAPLIYQHDGELVRAAEEVVVKRAGLVKIVTI